VPLGNTLRRLVMSQQSSGQGDPLGLGAALDEYFLTDEDPFKFEGETAGLMWDLMTSEEIRDRDPKIFHASSSSNCRRQQVLIRLGITIDLKRVDPLDAIQRMDDGKWGHIKWQLILHKMGILQRCEFKVSHTGWKAGGAPDGVILIPWLRRLGQLILEIKRVSDYRFKNIIKSQAPERSHIYQTHVYQESADIHRTAYLYENKNTNQHKIILQERDPRIVRELSRRYKYMNRWVDRKVPPKPECKLNSSDMMYRQCPVKDQCIKILKEQGLWAKYGGNA